MKPPKESEISTRSLATQSRKLRSKVSCQELIRMGAMKKLGGRLQGNRSRESTSFITQGNTASGTNGNAQMVSTTAITDIIACRSLSYNN